jgi:hypothetical protein
MENLKKWGVTFGALSTIITLLGVIHDTWFEKDEEKD